MNTQSQIVQQRPESTLAIKMTMPLYYRNGKTLPTAGVMAFKNKMNIAHIGLAFKEDGLLGIRTLPQAPKHAIVEINQIQMQQKDFAYQHGLYNGFTAEQIGTDKVGKIALHFATQDTKLAHLQRQVALAIAPVARQMFSNRMSVTEEKVPVYQTVSQSSTGLQATHFTCVQVDTPCDPQRVSSFFAATMGTKKQCERTLAVLKTAQPDDAATLYSVSRDDILALSPDDRQGHQALSLLSLAHSATTAKTVSLYI